MRPDLLQLTLRFGRQVERSKPKKTRSPTRCGQILMEPGAEPCGTVAGVLGADAPAVFAAPVSAGLLEQAASISKAAAAIATFNRIFEPFDQDPWEGVIA